MLIRDGGVIAEGFDDELDELRAIANNADQYLVDLEAREKERTGIPTLKLGYNRVHGYYIEISKGQAGQGTGRVRATPDTEGRGALHHAGAQGIRGQGAVCARARARPRESPLRNAHRHAARNAGGAQGFGRPRVATVDVLTNLAERAVALNLSRPVLTDRNRLDIVQGRHLVVEHVIDTPFIANDLALDETRKLLVITGPNMGGKSTFMRQTALIAILAHIGSYVPAESLTMWPDRPDLSRASARVMTWQAAAPLSWSR